MEGHVCGLVRDPHDSAHPLMAPQHRPAYAFVGAAGNVGTLAALVVHRRDTIAVAFDEIHAGDEPQASRG